MPDIFNSRPGSVLQVAVPGGALPFQIQLEGWDGFSVQKAIITSIGLQQSGNFQFLHTLRNFVYVYVFGEKIAEMVVSGVCFLNPCPTEQGAGRSGFEEVYAYYMKNRMVSRPTPVKMVIGTSITLEAFLTNVNIVANNPAEMIGQFTLNFSYLPDQGV